MVGILDRFREKVAASVSKEDQEKSTEVDDLIALGVLLWVVAQADDEFLPHEQEKIEEVLKDYSQITEEDMPIVLRAVEEASRERIDIHTFTREVSTNLKRGHRIEIIENLFRVACADHNLHEAEHEMIRKISGLFRLDHEEFIESKIKVKKEFGMDTAGL